jgi:outer membrane receptor protein involved in Fe transport
MSLVGAGICRGINCGFFFVASLLAREAALKARQSFFSSERERGTHGNRLATIGVLLLLSTMLCGAARSAEPVYDIEIPSMNAAEALNRFAEQTGAIMLFSYDLASAKRANAVRGRYTLLEGLDLLLRGTGLSGGLSDKRVVNISPAGDRQRLGEEAVVQKEKASWVNRVAAVVGSIFAASGAAGQDVSGSAQPIEEIVVTAQKRVERLQDVPTSVTAIPGDKLYELGLSQLSDYAQYVPGLAVQNGGSPGQVSVTLRGIAGVGPGSVVGYYIDDTPLGSSSNYAIATLFALDLMPYDLERLEVLRGPQGTLYGAGAMGGLLKYVLKQADTTAFSARLGGEVSDTDGGGRVGYAARGEVNIPIIDDKLAIRASAYDKHYQGYTDDVFLGAENSNTGRQYGGRVALTWEPLTDLHVNLGGIWNRTSSDDNAVVTLGSVTTYTDDGATYYRGAPTLGNLAGSHPFLQPFSKAIDYYSATVVWDASAGVTLTSATSWSQAITHRLQDSTSSYGLIPAAFFGMPEGYSNYHVDLDLKKFTQEVRAASATGGRFEWLAGIFYTDESSENHQRANVFDTNYDELSAPPISSPVLIASLPSTYEEYAGFGSLTLNVTEKLDVTGGVRIARNEQDFRQILDGLVLGGFADVPGRSSESVTTWSISSRLRFTSDAMVYGKIATGYRPGGPNAAVAGAVPTVDSDTLTSYELGLKSTFLEGRALLNMSVYDIEWEDIQLAVNNATCSCAFLANAGDAYSRGFELEGSFRPAQGLVLGYNAAYTKAQLTSLLPDVPGLLTDIQLPGVPKWSGGLTADYSWPLNASMRANIGAGIRYVGEKNANAVSATDPNTRDPSYTTGDVRAGLSNGKWSANLFVRNLTNKRVYLTQAPLTNPFTGDVPAIDALPLEARVAGVSFDVSF